MRLRSRLAFGVAVLFSMNLIPAVVARAVTNDNFADRQVIGLGEISFDLSDATRETFDGQATGQCGSTDPEVADHTAWFELDVAFSPNQVVAIDIVNDTFGELEYMVVTGEPNAFTEIACGTTGFRTRTVFRPVEDETYYLIAYDWDGPGEHRPPATDDRRATLAITASIVEPLELTSVATTGAGLVDGKAVVFGTYVCRGPMAYLSVDPFLTQNVGRGAVIAATSFWAEPPTCDGTPQPWSAEEYGGMGGWLAGGPVSIELTAFGYDESFEQYDSAFETRKLVLTGTAGRGPRPAPLPDAVDVRHKTAAVLIDSPAVRITLSPQVRVGPEGQPTLRGEYVCASSSPVNFVTFDVTALQQVGRSAAVAFGFDVVDPACDGSPKPWEFELAPAFGTRFAGGALWLRLDAYVVDNQFRLVDRASHNLVAKATPAGRA